MKIGINATYAVLKNKTGIGFYTFNLIHSLADVDKKNEYILYYNRQKVKSEDFIKIKNPNFKHKFFIPKLSKFIFDKLDIFHEPAFRYIKPFGTKSVVTIHDITSVFNYDFMSEKFRKNANRKLKKSILKADKIIAVSKNTKNDILKYFNIPQEKVDVVYHGVEKKFFVLKNREQAREFLSKRYKLKDKYLLYVGTIETRKNVANLIAAYLQVKKRIKGIKLVLIGGKGYGYEFLSKLIESTKKYGVVYYNYIQHNDLNLFYNCAEAFIYPSFYEGFGLPVIEAISCGTPVLTSNNSSLSEIGKKYVHYVDPFNIKSIEDGIIKIIKDKSYAKQLWMNALKYVKRFSWEKTARNTIKVYKKLLIE